MAIWNRSGILATALLIVACDGDRPPAANFAFSDAGAAVPVVVLKSEVTVTPRGYRVPELHVLLPVAVSEPDARASLQHVIDSVAQADTLAAAVRVVGFLIGDFDVTGGTAEVEPVLSAFWQPTDSVGITGSVRRARFRTTFRVLRPFAAGTTSAPGN